MLMTGFNNNEYRKPEGKNEDDASTNLVRLERNKTKYKKALERLNDLYLFDKAGISKKDYLTKKNEIVSKLEENELKLNEVLKASTTKNSEIFIDKAKYFLITKEIQQAATVDFKKLIDTIGNDLLANFIDPVISEVKVSDKQVHSIKFKSGVTHHFVYKPLNDKSNATIYEYPKNGAYRKHFDTVLKHVKENGYMTRTEVENLTDMKRYSALTLLNELIAKEKLERQRHSVAVRYCLKEN